jgi:hypothetical protein
MFLGISWLGGNLFCIVYFNHAYNTVIDKYGETILLICENSGLLEVHNWVTKLNLTETLTAWVFTVLNQCLGPVRSLINWM